MITVKTNLRNNALTQYSGYPFESFCVFNGIPLGAGPEGIFRLDQGGDKDIYDLVTDERWVSAWFELPMTSMGHGGAKQCRRLFVGGEFTGTMEITVRTTDSVMKERTYTVSPRSHGLVQHAFEVPVSFVPRSEYWGFTVENQLGSDFSIDFIDGIFIPATRRLGV